MDSKALLAYRNRLLDAGIARRKVHRNLQEVQDHFRDLEARAQADGLDSDAAAHLARQQLGSLDHLADAMIAGNTKSLAHRHPIAITVLLPLLSYTAVCLLLLAGLMLAVGLPSAGAQAQAAVLPSWLSAFADYLTWMQGWLITPLLASLLIIFSIRNRVPLRYWLLGITLLCIFGSGLSMMISLPDPATGQQGMLGLSFGYRFLTLPGFAVFEGNTFRLLLNLSFCAAIAGICKFQNRSSDNALPGVYG